MTHILVKWATAEAWDVYPTRSMLDVAAATQIMKDPAVVETFTGRTFTISWKEGEAPAEAYLVVAGDADKLERKRNRLATRATAVVSNQHKGCCEHMNLIRSLDEENKALKRKLEDRENIVDSAKMVRRLKRIVAELNEHSKENAEMRTPVLQESTHANIGGVMVPQATLTRLQETYRDAPSKFARSLMRVLFSDEEMVNRSLFGKPANSHKEVALKPALDPKRVEAVLEYTCEHFKCPDTQIKRSLGSMLQKINKKNVT